MVLTTEVVRRPKLQSNRLHQQTQHPVFLQAVCPSCHPTNSVLALKGNVKDGKGNVYSLFYSISCMLLHAALCVINK